MSAAITVDRRPVRPGALLALLAAALAVGLVADRPVQLLALGAEIAGLAMLALGRRKGSLAGGALAFAGGAVVAAALVAGATMPARLALAMELVPGMVGVAALAAGVAPLRSGWERRFVALGAVGLVIGVIASGVVRGSGEAALLAAIVLAVVAWDAGEGAISLGEQVGRAARTRTVVLVHAAASAVVGTVGALLAAAVYGVGVTGLPLAGLAALLGSVLALAVALDG